MDCGREGVESTLEIAAQNSVQTVGIGLDMKQAEKPIIVENDGADIGIIAVTQDETPQATDKTAGCVWWDNNEKIKRMIVDVKTKCRWCVVVVHSGPEFCQLMPPSIRKQYKKYLKFGADIVIGHHPHVVENYEQIGDKVIFYYIEMRESWGATDAADLSHMGITCLEGFGTIGGGLHELGEYAYVDSLTYAAKRLSAVAWCIE